MPRSAKCIAVVRQNVDRSTGGLPLHSLCNCFSDVIAQRWGAEVRPSPHLAVAEMLKVISDAPRTASEVIGHMWPDRGPAQTGTVHHRSVDVRNISNPARYDVDGFAPQSRCQSIRDVSGRIYA